MRRFSTLFISFTACLLTFCSTASTGAEVYKYATMPLLIIHPAEGGFSGQITYVGSDTICQGQSLQLRAPSGTMYEWLLNDASIPGATFQNYLASQPGEYKVVVDGDTSFPVTLTVHPTPTADFSYTLGGSCSSVYGQFTNNSAGATSYSWDFGDFSSGAQNTSTATDPAHHFIGSSGTGNQSFNVALTATNSYGCSATSTQVITTPKSSSTILAGDGLTPYNGGIYFTNCSSTPTNFNFVNQSATTNTGYVIQWGDGSPDFISASFTTTTHNYNSGSYDLLYIVTTAAGCVDTGYYHVFIGSNPAIGFTNPGSSNICTGSSLTFPITNTDLNSPGTTYKISFNDGSDPIVFQQPAPPSITHVFERGSCGTNSPSYANSFYASIQASNPCNSSAATVEPIYVSQKPNADFMVTPGNDTVCINTLVTFNNNILNNANVNGTCTPGDLVWTITPATGWTMSSGTTGNDNGFTNPVLWTSGSPTLGITFTEYGTYRVRFKIGNNICGADSSEKLICVNPLPVANFTLDKITGCFPLAVQATNIPSPTNCGDNTYNWTVSYVAAPGCLPATASYSFTGGTSATSVNPQFQFSSPGVYTITLVSTSPGAGCVSDPFSQTVTVQGKPNVTMTAPASICVNESISPTATANCFTDDATYAWTFTGGTPAASTDQVPGNIQYTTVDNYNVSLDVTNACGTTNITQPLAVVNVTTADAGSAQNICGSTATMAGNVPVDGTGVWTRVSGPNIPAITDPASPTTTITGLIPGHYIFQWKISNGSCTSASTVDIIISSGPTPAQAGPDQGLCQATSVTLAGNTPAIGAGEWTIVSSPNLPIITDPASPASTVTGLVPGNYTFRWTTSFSNCAASSDEVNVIVYDQPTQAQAGGDQVVCSGTATMAGNTPLIGTGRWSRISGPSVPAITTPASPTTTITGLVAGTYLFEWRITNGPCDTTRDTAMVTVTGALTTAEAGPDQSWCDQTMVTLAGNIPVTGTGTWTTESAPNVPVITDPASPNTTVTGLIPGEYIFRWTISNGGICDPNSDDVRVTIYDHPTAADAGLPQTVCTDAVTMQANTPVLGAGAWALVSGPNVPVITDPVSPATTVTNLIAGQYIFSWTITNGACSSTANDTITVMAAATLANAGPDQSWCALTSVTLAGNTPAVGAGTWTIAGGPNLPVVTDPALPGTTVTGLIPGVYRFVWTITNSVCPPSSDTVQVTIDEEATVSGAGPKQTICDTFATMAANTPSIGAGVWAFITGASTPVIVDTSAPATLIQHLTTGQYVFSWTITNGTCSSTSNDTIVVSPHPTTADAGPDQTLCASATTMLAGNAPSVGAGTWYFISGPNTPVITDPTSNTSGVTGLVSGVYQFRWSVSNSVCPPSNDTVQIKNLTDITNIISAETTTVCYGQSVILPGQSPAGGNGAYTYQWQQSFDGTNWTNIIANAQNDTTPPLTTSVYYRRGVTSLPCQNYSNVIYITVQPPVGNNTIDAKQVICTNTTAATIAGSTPTGGDNNYIYQWQQSIDNGANWTDIEVGILKDFDPGVLTQTTLYRRKVTTLLCSGPQADTSNIDTVTVHPDAKAQIGFSGDSVCAQHNLFIQNLSPSGVNSTYLWYANGVQIGSGAAFPDYAIANPNDAATIKMVAVSLYGCKNDSVTHTFYSYLKPAPAFVLSDNEDCGPLTVSFNNTTPSLDEFQYSWDFGNGQTSANAHPGDVTFAPNPLSGDTVYTVRLSAYNSCDTEYTEAKITVHAKPNAIFTPDKTTGCSTGTFIFTNVSQGLGMSYVWDFGDGTILSTSSNDPLQHVYHIGNQETFNVKLKASNVCGVDSSDVNVIVTPNTIQLNFVIDGASLSGCGPLTAKFINNSTGGNVFKWDFGDGTTLNTTSNSDIQTHTYTQPGLYTVSIEAINTCSDTTAYKTVEVLRSPVANFTASATSICTGDSVVFTNQSDTATAYSWDFGDGIVSNEKNPKHAYTSPGTYNITYVAILQHINGQLCVDTAAIKTITVTDHLAGQFSITGNVSPCAPFDVTFTNQVPDAVMVSWDFGDGSNGTGNVISHRYETPGTYTAILTATVSGGCKYIAQKVITVGGPDGTLQYTAGYGCKDQSVRFEVTATGTDSYKWDFGDGQVIVSTDNVAFHSYATPGSYVPKVTLLTNSGCSLTLAGADTIKINYITAGFSVTQDHSCGYTVVTLTDTSHSVYGESNISWDFGDGTLGSGITVTHTYNFAGDYTIRQAVTANGGCTDQASTTVGITISQFPVANIAPHPTDCQDQLVSFNAAIQSAEPISKVLWSVSNGLTGSGTPFNARFPVPGTFTVQLIAGTAAGCYDTTSTIVEIDPSPDVFANGDLTLCRGNSAPLFASGAPQLSWSPLEGLSCTVCSNPVATPVASTAYVVTGTNTFGCSDNDTVFVTVIQPFRMTATPGDSICEGKSAQLQAIGAITYSWSPADGLNSTIIPNPLATPSVTTLYRVVGFDDHHCFTDTAYSLVAVGENPTVSLGQEQDLASGTLYTFTPVVENGPVTTWLWSPAEDLSCSDCPNPVATIKDDMVYKVTVTNNFGCAASATLSIKAFCKSAQVFIPDAFTPLDPNGNNSVFMIRGSGFTVKSFRIFSRWGQLIFERTNFEPNLRDFGWDGKINGVTGEPEVYVYMAEVVCDNGVSYTYKGNVTLLK